MPSIGHVAVGLAAGRLQAGDGPRVRTTLVMTALATFPDLDVLGWFAGVGHHSAWAHRGALHSLLVAALAAAVASPLLARPRGAWPGFLLGFAAAASHGLLDTVTHGGSGVMLLWPFTPARFLAPWHPLPAAPIGLAVLSRGLALMAAEAMVFSPFLVYALWPRRSPRAASRSAHAGTLERST